ncbi:hypothetical protein OIV83_001653 [Microbotryomycetes sp. JL201]|nr:hypothetical protein OIV83_001653 [Microbotryomycetes sp. JL201]
MSDRRRPTLAMPGFVSSLFATFPLVTWQPDEPPLSGQPPKATLWVYGPPHLPAQAAAKAAASESLDPSCRQAQALARFTGLDDCTVKWLDTAAGAPGQTLPALHLSDGQLLSTDEISKHLLGPTSTSTSDKGSHTAPPQPGSPDPSADPTRQAFTALLQTALLPAVLAAIYLSPSSTQRVSVLPQRQLPFVTSIFMSLNSRQERSARIAEIKKLRGGKEGPRVVLDLEAVEREAVEGLGAFEAKMRSTEADGPYFGGRGSPDQLDAWLYSVLSIIDELPRSNAAALKEKLDRCPSLLAWVQDKRP